MANRSFLRCQESFPYPLYLSPRLSPRTAIAFGRGGLIYKLIKLGRGGVMLPKKYDNRKGKSRLAQHIQAAELLGYYRRTDQTRAPFHPLGTSFVPVSQPTCHSQTVDS